MQPLWSQPESKPPRFEDGLDAQKRRFSGILSDLHLEDPKELGPVTTYKTSESPFKSDNTASNQCGVTLMNNQVGAVVADVMKTKDNVTVRYLPSMIRVDAVGTMVFDYDEISEALGEEPGFYDAAEFEENMSHPLRPDDPRGRPDDHVRPTRRTPPSTSASTSPRPAASHGVQRFTTGPRRGGTVYEKDGEKYFVVDSHMHYWNAAPDNWVQGAEQYAKGWIECFHAYQSLGPPETHWSIEHFQSYSEDDLMKDVFEDGYVDVAVFQPTYLKEWYKEGFNTTEKNAEMGKKHPGKFIYNTRFDPRDGDVGLEQLKKNVDTYGSIGVKLYTAEWNNGSRGYKLSDPGAYRFLEAAQNLGIKNVHVHKGPTIWPLDKDAFDVSDVDHAATDFPDLNFIVEHVGLPRIEDFCFMATQEPNVYAGLSVVIGGLMYARPKFFAKVMGELLFWVGEDKMTFGSDYGIWEPKWQIEGFVDWDYPSDEFSDYPRVNTATKKKILGLNAAKLYGIDVPQEYQLKDASGPASQDDAQLVDDTHVATGA